MNNSILHMDVSFFGAWHVAQSSKTAEPINVWAGDGGMITMEKGKEPRQNYKQPAFVNLRWHTFTKETVEKFNGDKSSVQGSSCSGYSTDRGCGCGGSYIRY